MNKAQRGVALVEFALILPMLLVLTLITTEFGRAMYQYNTLTKSVRDAARYLSMQLPGTQMAVASNLIVYGSMTNTGRPLVPGLSASNVMVPVWEDTEDPVITTVTVGITGFTFQPLFASVFGITFAPGGVITFSDILATMRSAATPYTPPVAAP